MAPALERWRWLDELRLRFDLGVEVLDQHLLPIFEAVSNLRVSDLRSALENQTDSSMREAVAATVRAGRPRFVSAADQRARLVPLFMHDTPPTTPTTVGILIVADILPAAAEAVEALDRRLAATAEWLAAAIEASIGSTSDQADEALAAQRLASLIDVIDAISRLDDELDVIDLALEALAIWYDADVRAYRQDLAGSFVLHASLPGIDRATAAPTLAGHQIWGREDVFRLQSYRDLSELGWDPPPAPGTLFMPITVEDSTEWLFTVLGGGGDDPAVVTNLRVLARSTGSLLTNLVRDRVERARRTLGAILSFTDAPFAAIAQNVLDALVGETRAASATVAVYYESHAAPILVLSSGGSVPSLPPALVDAGALAASTSSITVGAAAGARVTAVLALRSGDSDFQPMTARLARSAAAVLANWLAGALVRPSEIPTRDETAVVDAFADRLRSHLDRLGRMRIGGAVVVVIPADAEMTGPALDASAQLIQDNVRTSDVVGLFDQIGAAVLLADVTAEVASAVVERLARDIRLRGVRARVGMATFSTTQESPESLLNRALINARHRSTW